ncbi:hypothetical protein BGZ98_008136 [Dissophora globulifera]|nr:hypothetical protein BGZ98_008136 [Dissophora globulifera]
MSAAQRKTQPKVNKGKEFSQARHGGGTCEFSLSYDGGKTFGLIGKYTKTCPDAYYTWPVKIPKNVASCTSSKKYNGKKNQCLFVWSWTANILPQYYQNCADVNIAGSGSKKPKGKIQVVDFKGHKTGVTEKGDGDKHSHGPGPQKSEITYNMKHNFM